MNTESKNVDIEEEETDFSPEEEIDQQLEETEASPSISFKDRVRRLKKSWILFALFTYIVGIISGYVLWGQVNKDSLSNYSLQKEVNEITSQINPKNGFRLPVTYGKVGPMTIQAGAIDLEKFKQVYVESGRPLNDKQLQILTQGSDETIIINSENQAFLLNLFWAFGLANQNRILTDGPMMQEGKDKAMQMASTGGWPLATKPVQDVYAHSQMVMLTDEQQQRLEEVAKAVYRPCCNNPTHFPDCNHGMAMLGLLELMASQDASTEQMFQAAKQVNAFWFPQQTLEVALAFKTEKNQNFDKIDARQAVGINIFSGSGYQTVHAYLTQQGKLGQVQQGGGGCGVN